MDEKERSKAIGRASQLGIIGNAVLAVLKIAAGMIAGSAAVIADGIDSASDIIGSLVTFYTSQVSETPPDKEHPWGHRRIEAIATKVIALFILFAGIQLLISTAGNLLQGSGKEPPGQLAVTVTFISIVGKSLMALYKFRVGRRYRSSMVIADAVNMRNDIVISLAVLAGLGLTYLTGLHLIDSIVGLLLGILIIVNGAKLSLEINGELMDSFEERETVYRDVFSLVAEVPGALNPHRARIRKLNNQYDISLDIEVDPSLSIGEAHEIAGKVEEKIREKYPETFDVMIHVEPQGNREKEQFGLRPEDF
ncbi:MAG: cation diffusion facilitator family transporter [Spirochaetales bacterium]|nr:cation diffusion facilitator family transporter [Spirochaetales bacterium]